jgi:O-methyltransferase
MRVPSSDDAARLMDPRAHLAAAREPCAGGPAPDAETLRGAYLDVLKLCLCDLGGTTTVSVGAMPDGTVMSRELRGDERRLRAAGMDWPLQGLTMVGLGRLDDLQTCVESVVADGVSGDLIEAGAWRGGASILMRATLDTLGDQRTVWVADSFQGFAEAETPRHGDSIDLAAFAFLAVSEADVRESFARLGCERGVRFVPGFFEETLASLARERWAIVRLDADTYEPTREALRCLYPGLAVGGYLIVDDYGSFEGCRRAVDEFRSEHGIAEPLECVDSTCVRWRRESEGPIITEPALEPRVASRPRAEPQSRANRVPTARELELARELGDVRDRLAVAEARIGLRAWLRRRLGRGPAR